MQAAVSPADPLAHNFLATKYLQAGRVDDAVAQLNEALRLKPGDAEAHSNLATALQAQGRIAEAVQHAREAVRLKSGDDRVHFNLGNLMMAGQADGSRAELRQAVQIDRTTATRSSTSAFCWIAEISMRRSRTAARRRNQRRTPTRTGISVWVSASGGGQRGNRGASDCAQDQPVPRSTAQPGEPARGEGDRSSGAFRPAPSRA
jgi:tetratricopeptide (TPR) repeat protein